MRGEGAGREGTRTEAGGDRTAAAPVATAATAPAESAESGAAAAAAAAAAVAGDEVAPWCPLGGGAAVLRLLLMRGAPVQRTRTLTLTL